jgi:hypothetical protein
VAYLVPFRMSSGDKFEKFIACWFAFQFQLGRSLRNIFNNYDSASLFCFVLIYSIYRRRRDFLNLETKQYFSILYRISNLLLLTLNLSTAGNIENLFGLATPSEGYRVWVIEKQSNPGFDLMISYSTPEECYQESASCSMQN